MEKPHDFVQARTDFLAHLRYGRARSVNTCYAYNSDLGLWHTWLETAGHDWCACTHVEVEGWITWQMRERSVKPQIVARRASCLSVAAHKHPRPDPQTSQFPAQINCK